MSSFHCEHCGKSIIDSPKGYITFCKHHPKEKRSRDRDGKELKMLLRVFGSMNRDINNKNLAVRANKLG